MFWILLSKKKDICQGGIWNVLFAFYYHLTQIGRLQELFDNPRMLILRVDEKLNIAYFDSHFDFQNGVSVIHNFNNDQSPFHFIDIELTKIIPPPLWWNF